MQHSFVEQAKQKSGFLRNLMMRGMKFLLPFMVVIWCAHFALSIVEDYLGGPSAAIVRWLVPHQMLGAFADGRVPGMSMALLLLVILGFGAIASWKFSYRGLRVAVDAVMPRIPVLGGLYKASSQIIDTFGDAESFKRVVLIPLFNGRVPAFVTNESVDENTGEKWLWVFLPMTPNPTSGFNFMVLEKDSVCTDWTPQETLKRMMSLGVLMPEKINFGNTSPPPAA